MLAVTLVVIVVAQNPEVDTCEPGVCGGAAMVSAFQQAVQRVLGGDAHVQMQLATEDPPDEASVAQAQDLDGVVELSFTPEGQKAHLHCYLSREKRWLDRDIHFGESRGSVRSEISERGRLLGFAVATMYASDADGETEPPPPLPPTVATPAPKPVTTPRVVKQDRAPRPLPSSVARRTVEFAVIGSSGLDGTAAGLGANAGFRFGLTGPLWVRFFVAGRSGNIPAAQANTRTVLMGGGFAAALLPAASAWELGARLDGFASYFDVSHLSEDDAEPDRRSRWQAGADLVAEGGLHITSGVGVFLGLGLEAVLGKTEIYTHQKPVAVVPPFRTTAELGFRTRF